jgi:unsaturated chondroitin disaccharide hydrolase
MLRFLGLLVVVAPSLFFCCNSDAPRPVANMGGASGVAGSAANAGADTGGSTAAGGRASEGGAAGEVSGAAGASVTAGSGGSSNSSPGGSSDGGITDAGGAAGASDGGAGAAGASGAATNELCDAALSAAIAQYRGFVEAYPDAGRIPRSAQNGTTRFVAARDWTSGFVAGSLWYLFEASAESEFREAAETRTWALGGQQHQTGTHDVGFIINSSFGNALRLTQDPSYADVLTTAAASLSTRFNPIVGATRSWDSGTWSFPVIIDNMMNLELLFRGSSLSAEPVFAQIAEAHALTTDAHHFRDDSSSYHLVDFDPETGGVLSRETVQGLADESSWARGQAWGLYGFSMAYRESGNARFLERAQAIADFLVDNPTIPADGVPYFDFSAPVTDGVPALRDASAAAVMASALLELRGFVANEAGTRYLNAALHLLESLSSPAYSAAVGENGHFILMHSVGDFQDNSEVDVAINYADYYYLEALLRCRLIARALPR